MGEAPTSAGVRRHGMVEEKCRELGRPSVFRRASGGAHRFKAALMRRLEKFKLSLAEEKTGVHLFIWFRKRNSKRFDFLGFEYRWGKDQSCLSLA